MDTKNTVLAVLAAVGSFIANQLGGWDSSLAFLIGCMAVDYITGLIRAGFFHNSTKTESGKLSSEASYKGLVRKLMTLGLVWLGVMLDEVTGTDYIRNAVILFFLANEALSILENAVAMGVKTPPFLKKMLEVIKDKSDNATK